MRWWGFVILTLLAGIGIYIVAMAAYVLIATIGEWISRMHR
jgi:hypothetical protein